MSFERKHTTERSSQITIHGDTVYLAGQVARDAPGASVAEQTADILERIDTYLAEAGTDKSRILTATVWMSDIERFGELNEVWNAWTVAGKSPCRACVEARLANEKYAVEIMVVAAR